MPEQLQNWHCCQICGRVADDQQAEDEGWLVGTYRKNAAVRVVRCYRHISDWSLWIAGKPRTNEWRDWAEEGRVIAEAEPNGIHPLYEPFPVRDEPPYG